jgi:hypothetical protein
MNTLTCAIVAIAIALATGLAAGGDPADHGAHRTALDIRDAAPSAAGGLLRI